MHPIFRLSPLLLAGCTSAKDSIVSCGADEIAEEQTCVPESCGTGEWGDLPVDDRTLFVSADADSGGDGSRERPLQTVRAALDLAAHDSQRTVALAAGTYTGQVEVLYRHTGLQVMGRCSELVTLDGAHDGEGPVIEVAAGNTGTFSLSGVTVTRGVCGGLEVSSGTATVGQATFTDNGCLGMSVWGTSSVLNLEEVRVDYMDESAPDRDHAWGVEVNDGGTLNARGLTIESSAEVGLFIDESVAEIEDLVVRETRSNDQEVYGVGLQASYSTVSLVNASFQSNRYLGLYFIESELYLDSVSITDTRPDADENLGIGLSAHGSILTGSDLEVVGNRFSGIYLEQSEVTLEDLVVRDTLTDSLGEGGRALQVDQGALELDHATLSDSIELGLIAQDSTLALVDVAVEDTRTGADGTQGSGIQLDACTFDVQGVTLEDNHYIGLNLSGCQGQLEDLVVRGTRPDDAGALGAGVQVIDDSTVSWTGGRIVDNHHQGLLVDASTVTLQEVEFVDTHLPLDQGQGAGIALTSGSTLTARRCRIAGSEGIGIYTTGSALTLEEVEIVDNLPDGDGRYGIGILAVQGSEIRALATRVHGNHHAGIAAMESQLELVDTVLSGNLRSTSSTSGPGLYLQQSSVTAQGLVSSGNDGPGAVVADGSLTCTGCTMEDNSFAGLVLYSGALELVDSTVVDTRADVNEGGGYGVLAAELDAPSTITVNGSTLSGHPEAALVFAGAGTFTVEECTLADSAGTGGPTLSGIGLAAVGSDPGSNSVQLSQSILEGLGGAAVFVDGMTTELYENTYQDNGVDLVVQQCDETGTGTADWTADSVATTDICPTYDYPFELGSYAVFLEDIAIDFRR